MINGIITVAAFVAFIVVVVWAVWPANKARFDEAAQLPLVDDSNLQNHSHAHNGSQS